MRYLESNLKAIADRFPEIAAQLEEAVGINRPLLEEGRMGCFQLAQARSGDPTVRYLDGTGGKFVHSSYDPRREAAALVEGQLSEERERDFVIASGLGMGYALEEAARRLGERTNLFFYEPHTDLFLLALAWRDLTWLFGHPNLDFTVGEDFTPLLRNLAARVNLATVKGFVYLEHPILSTLPKGKLISGFGEQVRVLFFQLAGNLQTMMYMGPSYLYHSLVSFEEVIRRPPVKVLFDQFGDLPGIIVSAGPSLEKNVDLIRELALDRRAVIVAVDTALKPLLARGIEPHIVCTGDPQEANYKHLKGAKVRRSCLVAEPQAPPKSVAEWTGPEIFFCSFDDQFMRWLNPLIGHRGLLRTWGSVATMAYDLVLQMGCDPIIFIGQDLSYPGGKTYVSGTYFEEEDAYPTEVEGLRERNVQLYEVEDIYGNKVLTNRQMLAYLEYFRARFEEDHGRTLINATEGGALTHPRLKIMSLREAVESYMQGESDIDRRILSLASSYQPPSYRPLRFELDQVLAEMREGLDECQRMVVECARVRAICDRGGSADQVVPYYNRIVRTYHSFVGKKKLIRFLKLANHAALHTFERGIYRLEQREKLDLEFVAEAAELYHTLFVTSRDALERMIPLFEDARDVVEEIIAGRRGTGAALHREGLKLVEPGGIASGG